MSWQLAVLRRWLRWTARPLAARIRNWNLARRIFTVSARLGFRRAKDVTVTPWQGGLCLRPPGPAPAGAILYLHGGAYIVGSPEIYRALAGCLASMTGCAVYVPRYPLAPEHPAPAAFEAAVGAWHAVESEGFPPGAVAICGDSAGGGLALALLSDLLTRDVRPACCVAFAPWTDMTLSGRSLTANAPSDVVLPAERVPEVRDLVLQGGDPKDPRLSPLLARFPDCPPVYISYGTAEILRDDAVRMIAVLESQGARVTREEVARAPHVWQLFHGWVPEAEISLRKVAAFVRRALPGRPPSGS